MYYRSKVIVIKNMDLWESDKLLTVFSEQEGKFKAVAKGVKKPRSSLRACVQPACHSLLSFSKGRELDLITQGKLLEFYGNIREDFQRTLYALYIMELLDKSLMDRAPFPGLYSSTLNVLRFLDQTGYNPLIIRHFEMSLLISLGYKPILEYCVFCGRKDTELSLFSFAEGGLLCSDCKQEAGNVTNLSRETLAMIKLLSRANTTTVGRVRASAGALKQLESFLEKYLEYHLERKFNLKKAIAMLKKNLRELS